MNKIYVATALALSTVMLVSAEEGKDAANRPMPVQAQMVRADIQAGVGAPMMTTGDVTIDAQIKALRMEMEAKIKAIRDEYDVKIKAAIGDKKVVPVMASTTATSTLRRGEGEDRGEASDTENVGDNEGLHLGAQMQLGQNLPPDIGARVKSFLRGLFGVGN